MRLVVVALAVLMLGADSPADRGKTSIGFVFAKNDAALREEPSPGANVLARVPENTRLVFLRSVVDVEGRPEWFHVSFPGRPAGWIAFADTAPQRTGTPRPAKILRLVDSGLSAPTPATAAVRHPPAKSYAQKNDGLKAATDHFLTLEHAVDAYFADPVDPETGQHPDVTVPGRKKKAAETTGSGRGPATTTPPAPAPVETTRPDARSIDSKAKAGSDAQRAAIDGITYREEEALGRKTAISVIAQGGGLVLEETLLRYVNDIANAVSLQGERVARSTDGTPRRQSRRVYVGILDTPSLDAYSFPGGYILVTRGLLAALSSDSELAWILGREIAHIDNEHGLRALKTVVASRAFMKELSTPAEHSFKDPALFDETVDKMAEIQFKTGLSANDERLADSQGLVYATAAGYDAGGARRVLRLLSANAAVSPQKKVFTSIDTPERRETLLQKQIEGIPGGRMGVERFDRECAQALEAWAAARTTPAP